MSTSKSKHLRIGIDAKWFFEGPVSNQIVVCSLVENLIHENPGHTLYIFLNARHKSRTFPFQSERVRLVYVWAGNNMISNALFLPVLGIRLGIDVIIYQNFTGLFGPTKWTYIHDVIFLSHPQFFTIPERLYFNLMPILSRFADVIIAISAAERDRMKKYGLGKKCPIHVVHHAVSKQFVPREQISDEVLERVNAKYQLPPRFLLFVGRLNLRKNIGGLLKALSLTKNSSIQLVIVGEKDWKADPSIAPYAKEWNGTKRVSFLGKVPFYDLTVIYARATVFCFPSFAEGFGLPVLEAMQAGTPVLTTRNSAMEEVCEEAGTYIEPEDYEAIAEAIDTFWEDDATWIRQRAKGILRAADFSWSKSVRTLYRLLEEKAREHDLQ